MQAVGALSAHPVEIGARASIQLGDAFENLARQQYLTGNRKVDVIHHPLPRYPLRRGRRPQRRLHIRHHHPLFACQGTNDLTVNRRRPPGHRIEVTGLAKRRMSLFSLPQALQRAPPQVPQPGRAIGQNARLLQLSQRRFSHFRRHIIPGQAHRRPLHPLLPLPRLRRL